MAYDDSAWRRGRGMRSPGWGAEGSKAKRRWRTLPKIFSDRPMVMRSQSTRYPMIVGVWERMFLAVLTALAPTMLAEAVMDAMRALTEGRLPKPKKSSV